MKRFYYLSLFWVAFLGWISIATVSAQSGWSDFKFHTLLTYGQLNTPLEPGTAAFRKVFPNLENDINETSRKVIEVLYSSPSDPIPAAETMYYTVYPGGPLSGNASSNGVTNLTLNSEYVRKFYEEHNNDLNALREELVGVLSHELCHTFQAQPKGCGEYGSSPVFTSFIEGMADATRYLCGDHNWSKPAAGGHYLNGYSTTGFFLIYLQNTYDPLFIKKFNQTANELETWSYNAAIKRVLGDQYDVDQLWKEYQKTMQTEQPELPVVSETILSQAPGDCKAQLEKMNVANITDLVVKGDIDATDFIPLRKMPNLRRLNLKEAKIHACSVQNPFGIGYDNYNREDYIPECAFENNKSLNSVILPDNLKGISMMAFKRVAYLEGEFVLPATLQEIQSVAFEDDNLLQTIVSKATTPPALNTNFMAYEPFYGLYVPGMKLKVPKGSLDAYRSASVWKDFGTIEEFDPETTASQQLKALPATEVSFQGGQIRVKAPLTFHAVRVYDLKGQLIAQQASAAVNELSVPVQGESGSVCLVQVTYSQGNNGSYKVVCP